MSRWTMWRSWPLGSRSSWAYESPLQISSAMNAAYETGNSLPCLRSDSTIDFRFAPSTNSMTMK